MPDYQSKVSLQLDDLIRLTKTANNEQCCKLRELIVLAGGGSGSTSTLPGIVKLTSGGTATFTTATPLQGTAYHAVSISVISLTSGTVTVTDAHGATAISYPGFSAGWEGSLATTLSITVTGDAVAIITYSAS